jgi:hypothetical protein
MSSLPKPSSVQHNFSKKKKILILETNFSSDFCFVWPTYFPTDNKIFEHIFNQFLIIEEDITDETIYKLKFKGVGVCGCFAYKRSSWEAWDPVGRRGWLSSLAEWHRVSIESPKSLSAPELPLVYSPLILRLPPPSLLHLERVPSIWSPLEIPRSSQSATKKKKINYLVFIVSLKITKHMFLKTIIFNIPAYYIGKLSWDLIWRSFSRLFYLL